MVSPLARMQGTPTRGAHADTWETHNDRSLTGSTADTLGCQGFSGVFSDMCQCRTVDPQSCMAQGHLCGLSLGEIWVCFSIAAMQDRAATEGLQGLHCHTTVVQVRPFVGGPLTRWVALVSRWRQAHLGSCSLCCHWQAGRYMASHNTDAQAAMGYPLAGQLR